MNRRNQNVCDMCLTLVTQRRGAETHVYEGRVEHSHNSAERGHFNDNFVISKFMILALLGMNLLIRPSNFRSR